MEPEKREAWFLKKLTKFLAMRVVPGLEEKSQIRIGLSPLDVVSLFVVGYAENRDDVTQGVLKHSRRVLWERFGLKASPHLDDEEYFIFSIGDLGMKPLYPDQMIDYIQPGQVYVLPGSNGENVKFMILEEMVAQSKTRLAAFFTAVRVQILGSEVSPEEAVQEIPFLFMDFAKRSIADEQHEN